MKPSSLRKEVEQSPLGAGRKTDGANPSQHPQEGAMNQESKSERSPRIRLRLRWSLEDVAATWEMEETAGNIGESEASIT